MIHQPQAAVKPLRGEELLGEGDGQGAGQDAAVGVIPQVALAGAVLVADGQQGVGGVGMQVVEVPAGAGGPCKRKAPPAILRGGAGLKHPIARWAGHVGQFGPGVPEPVAPVHPIPFASLFYAPTLGSSFGLL
jgi:hypothetical protein